MVEIHTPPNEKVIGYVYVGLSEDEQGRNGIVAAFTPGIGGAPMVTASEKVLDHFKAQANDLARMVGRRIKIYRFIRVECIYDTEQL